MRGILTITFCFCLLNIYAQRRYQVLFVPSVNLNKKLTNGWKINLKAEFRQSLKNGFFNEEQPWDYQYLFTDISLVVSKKVGLNSSLTGGYQLRAFEESVAHRLIQQYAIVSRLENLRLGHRFAADQTMQNDASTAYRFRYRLSAEFPLNGQSVDPQELYLKASHEYVNSFEGSDYDLEIRLTPTLGYRFTDNNKTEIGLEYRINDFVKQTQNSRSRIFIQASWYLAF